MDLAYESVFMEEVAAPSNPWLASEFSNAGIRYALEIKTPTLGELARTHVPLLAAKLQPWRSVTASELSRQLICFADIRRNVDAHIYLQSLVVGSRNNDIEDVYLPVINEFLRWA